MSKPRGLNDLPQSATYTKMASPVGQLTIVTSKVGLHAILWDVDCKSLKYAAIIDSLQEATNEAIVRRVKTQLTEYFNGNRRVFDLPLVLDGTAFQIQAWQQLLQIPYATTISYAEQAEKIGDRKKARAVGMVNGLNPIPIIIPCHRVIGSSGKLVGFAGGVERKQWLLRHEQKKG